MASRKLEDRIEELRQLRGSCGDASADALLRKALDDRSNLMVAEAAKLAGELHRMPLIPDLLRALNRLFENPIKTDSKCWGKTAIVKALAALDYSESPPFVRGSRHIQMEPVWGGQEDAAIHFRANAFLALVQCTDLTRADILRHLVDALADSGDTVRIEAARALEQMNGEEAALVLRLKAHAGDRRPHVLGQVFDSLLQIERERGVKFVAGFMDSTDPEIRDEAALALGSCRVPDAIKTLMQKCTDTRSNEFRPVLLRALSSSRDESAILFLLDLVKTGTTRDAAGALDALQIHADSADIQDRIMNAKAERQNS